MTIDEYTKVVGITLFKEAKIVCMENRNKNSNYLARLQGRQVSKAGSKVKKEKDKRLRKKNTNSTEVDTPSLKVDVRKQGYLNVAQSVKEHRQKEDARANVIAVGKWGCIFEGHQLNLWLTNAEHKPIKIDDKERITEAIEDEFNKPIYKNSKLGELLIKNNQGEHQFQAPGGVKRFEIVNRVTYRPDKHSAKAYDLFFSFGSGETAKKFPSLESVFNQSSTKSEQNPKKESARKKGRAVAKARRFIRQQAQLRYQPVLDPEQEDVKRSYIFDGTTLVIDGGPGTGKTTSLIQRLKFLTDPVAMKEYLAGRKSEKLIQRISHFSTASPSWVFFSPSQLLAEFLKSSMEQEGLLVNNSTVKVWGIYKDKLFGYYGLSNTETQRPFILGDSWGDKDLFLPSLEEMGSIWEDIERALINYLKKGVQQILDLNIPEDFTFRQLVESFQKELQAVHGIDDVSGLISFFQRLEKRHKEQFLSITSGVNALLDRYTSYVSKEVKRSSDLATRLEQLFVDLEREKKDEDIEYTEEEQDEQTPDAIPLETNFEFGTVLYRNLRSLIRKVSLKKFDRRSRLSKRDLQLLEMIDLSDQTKMNEIGELLFVKKYFEKIVGGVERNIFSEIPRFYKVYRKDLTKTQKVNGWDYELLQDLIEKDGNKRLHRHEQALILSLINELIIQYQKRDSRSFSDSSHPYIQTYKDVSRCVIGVDEASDFHLIDLKCIYSLRDYEISSVTYSGDIMQGMTNDGISEWDDLEAVIQDFDILPLRVSYRQSPTLLKLAKEVVKSFQDEAPEYRSHLSYDKDEPNPLLFVNKREGKKIQWIADRICDIFEAYGEKLPSTAIFLPTENQVHDFSKEMGRIKKLSKRGINVVACGSGQILGDYNSVRAFSIEHIKGLEFEAVFFHNLDMLKEVGYPDRLLLKYLYVGLSRATFYLGATASGKFKDELLFLNDGFRLEDNWVN